MSRLEDDLKQTLRRKAPPADFAARVMDNIRREPQPLATVHQLHAPRHTRAYFNPRLLAIAATVALMILAGVLWLMLRRAPSQPVLVNKGKPAESKPQEKIGPDKSPPPSPEKKNVEQHAYQAFKRQTIPQQPARANKRQPVRAFQPEAENPTAMELQHDSYPVLDAETARHLKKAQLLLRSFRNTELAQQNGSTVDISFEKELSRVLLADNMLYRREAETRRNLPVKGVLSSLEPFLLDIANLSDKPVAEDVRQIKERMRKREIVAELQVYTAEAATGSF